jgi:bacillithiol system protein YtxJ
MSTSENLAASRSHFVALTTPEEVLAVLAAEGPQLLFLRDPWCPVSRDADDEIYGLGVAVPTIDVSKSHDLGMLVQEQTGIRHESPQVIVVKDGKAAWHASHYGIRRAALAEALAQDA